MKLKQFLLLLISIISLQSCKEECADPTNPECKNYNPCNGKTRTSAYFIVEESLGDYWIECDTIIGIGNASSVRFTALQNADSFIWKLGSEIINSKSFVKINFPQKQNIPVTLIVINKNPDRICNTNDDGCDTFSRTLYTWGEEYYWNNSTNAYVVNNPLPVQGKYVGSFESQPNKLVEITLEDTVTKCTKADVKSLITLKSINLPDGYFQPCFDDENCGYFRDGWTKRATAAILAPRAYRIGSYNDFNKDSIYQVKGFLQLSRDLKHVIIDFEYYPLWDEIEKKTIKKDKFKGTKTL